MRYVAGLGAILFCLIWVWSHRTDDLAIAVLCTVVFYGEVLLHKLDNKNRPHKPS